MTHLSDYVADVEVWAVLYCHRGGFHGPPKENVNNSWTETWETGAVMQEGVADHPAGHSEHVIGK